MLYVYLHALIWFAVWLVVHLECAVCLICGRLGLFGFNGFIMKYVQFDLWFMPSFFGYLTHEI